MNQTLNPHQPNQNLLTLSEEDKQVLAERALELEQLEDREYQATYRNTV